MKNNILFLVHTQEMFRKFFPDDMYALRLRKSAMARKYNRVVYLVADIEELEPIEELQNIHRTEKWYWSWGYDKEMFCCTEFEMGCDCFGCQDEKWIIPSYGHEYTYVPSEIYKKIEYWKNCNVFIGGGCDSACLQDWRDVLEYCEIEYEEIKGLIF